MEREDDPFWIIPPSPLDAPILNGPISKDRREDLQILSFALMLSLSVDGGHPVGISQGDDPPDRMLHVRGVPYAVELTELTVSDVRRDLAQARRLGRQLRERLIQDAARFDHLIGRRVVLSTLPSDGGLPRDLGPLLDKLSRALEEDRGGVGDGVDFSEGAPQQWPSDRGFYGQYGPVNLSTYRDGIPNDFLVASSCQSEVRLSQTMEVLNQRIRAKDAAVSNVLLISCGMPDEGGFACPVDGFMFRFIQENLDRIHLAPTHLNGVFLHLWGSNEWIELFRSKEKELVWPPASKNSGSIALLEA